MKTKLSPFVYKTKGKKNYLIFDSINKKLFHITPEGKHEELKAKLLENDLIIETEGVIPLKFTVNINKYKTNTILRELQIRITGRCDRYCKECGHVGNCFKDNKDMTKKNLKNIIKQFKHIIIESVVIIGGNPLLRMDLIKMVREGIISSEYKVFLKNVKPSENETKQLNDMGCSITDFVCEELCISEEDIEVDIFKYFYNQHFNPCWGSKMSIDIEGDIKPCLWSTNTIGNINIDNIKDMIFSSKFDYYWELSKDKFEVCNECEFRYLCSDCRVITLKDTGSIKSKTSYCKYNPEYGKWD